MLPRIKLRLEGNGKIISILLVLTGISLLLSAGYVYATPPVEQPEQQVDLETDQQKQPEEVIIRNARYPVEVFSIEVTLIDGAFVKNRNEQYDYRQFLTRYPDLYRNGSYPIDKYNVSRYFKSYSPDLMLTLRINPSKELDTVESNLIRERSVKVDRNEVDFDERTGDRDEVFSDEQLLIADFSPNVENEITISEEFNVKNTFDKPDKEVIDRFPTDQDGDPLVNVDTRLVSTVNYKTMPIKGPEEKKSYEGTIQIPDGGKVNIRSNLNEEVYYISSNKSQLRYEEIKYQKKTDTYVEVSGEIIDQSSISDQTKEQLNISNYNIISRDHSETGQNYTEKVNKTYDFAKLPNQTKHEIRKTLGIPNRTIKSSAQQEPPEPEKGDPNIQLIGVLLILGISTIGIGITIAEKVPQFDKEKLEQQVAHNQYSEWISEGDVLIDSDNEFVAVNSVKDLVNVGIDANKRVIYDPDLSVYTVSDDGVTYYYTTEPADLQRWAHL